MRTFPKFRLLVLALLFSIIPAVSHAGVYVNISIAPPVLPVYVQPPCPEPGYIWTPGYWAYGPMGYYWVPGTWVMAPEPGLLWTPGYWGAANGFYVWHRGYWGPRVGFYGGVNYGFGYPGDGFYGGRWVGNQFSYNTAIVNVNRTVIHNTYIDRTVVRNTTINRVSYNGPGGASARPTRQQQQAYNQRRFEPTAEQTQHRDVAGRSRENFYSNNRGRPAMAATARPSRQTFSQAPNEPRNQTRRNFDNNRQMNRQNTPENLSRPQPDRQNRPQSMSRPQPDRQNRPQNMSRPQPNRQYRENAPRQRPEGQGERQNHGEQWSQGGRRFR